MTAAKIPYQYRRTEVTIGTMPLNTSGWVTGWTVHIDNEWGCWLNPNTTVQQSRGGTLDTLVHYTNDGTYEVFTPYPPGGWSQRDIVPHGWIPVSKIEVWT